jgi:hypothetical protein
MSAIYIPHRHVTYNYDNVDNSNINQHNASTHRIESSDIATPLQHSKFIESKLKSSGVNVKRLSDVHLEADNVKIETHPNGTYLLGKDKNKLHDLHNKIHGISKKSNFKDALKGFLTNKKQNNDFNTTKQELMFEDVTQSYIFESKVNDQTKRIRVKAPNKQLAEEAAELYFKIYQEAK